MTGLARQLNRQIRSGGLRLLVKEGKPVLVHLDLGRNTQQAAQDAAARRAPQEMIKVPAELLEGLAAALPEFIPALVDFATNLLTSLIPGLADGLVGVVESLGEALPELIQGLIGGLGKTVSSLLMLVWLAVAWNTRYVRSAPDSQDTGH